MNHLHLTMNPIPPGETLEEILSHPIRCDVCSNLYPGMASRVIKGFFPTAAISCRFWGHNNVARKARTEDIESPADWAGDHLARLDYETYTIRMSLIDIQNSSARGCETCLLLEIVVGKIPSLQQRASFGGANTKIDATICKGDVMEIHVWEDTSAESDSDDDMSNALLTLQNRLSPPKAGISVYLYTLPGSLSPWTTVGSTWNQHVLYSHEFTLPGGPVGHILPDANSDPVFKKIQKWIQICKSSHLVCNQATEEQSKFFPKRVVDIGPDTNTEIHLVEDVSVVGMPYIALSYCWGKAKHLTTETKTFNARKHNISWNSLSRTFQDTIVIARRLSIRYLWIDSLCIIQDSLIDWKTESAKMAMVYSNAELVISATASADGNGGCLFVRPPFFTIRGTSPEQTPFEIYGRNFIDHSIFGHVLEQFRKNPSRSEPRKDIEQDRDQYPLMARAWCFQERLLARRLLHFTKDEIVFECCTSTKCECGALSGSQNDEVLLYRQTLLMGKSRYPQITPEGNILTPVQTEQTLEDYHSLWRQLVVDYSQKQITKTTDRLPAIAGLATRWSNVIAGRYLAGLWDSDLLSYMRWVYNENDDDKLECPLVAPSWSFLSTKRAVLFGWRNSLMQELEYFVQLDLSRTACQTDPLSPFGQVSSGHIFLTGHLLPVTLTVKSESCSLQGEGQKRKAALTHPDSLFRVKKFCQKQIFCLRFCNNAIDGLNSLSCDTALVLARPTKETLARQIKDVREHSHVYERIGITNHYETRLWEHNKNAQMTDLYLV